MKCLIMVIAVLLMTISLVTSPGCKGSQQAKGRSEKLHLQESCTSLPDLLSSNWKRKKNRADGYYEMAPSLEDYLTSGEGTECIQTLDKNLVKRLFGVPNMEFTGRMIYFINRPCNRRNSFCRWLSFEYNYQTGEVWVARITNASWSSD